VDLYTVNHKTQLCGQTDVVPFASLSGISLKLGEMLQIMMLMIFCSGREKSAPEFSSERNCLKIEGAVDTAAAAAHLF
jgi:hypothetical protein